MSDNEIRQLVARLDRRIGCVDDRLERLERRTDETWRLLSGNGKPESGLLYQVRLNTGFLRDARRIGWIALTAIVTGLAGGLAVMIREMF